VALSRGPSDPPLPTISPPSGAPPFQRLVTAKPAPRFYADAYAATRAPAMALGGVADGRRCQQLPKRGEEIRRHPPWVAAKRLPEASGAPGAGGANRLQALGRGPGVTNFRPALGLAVGSAGRGRRAAVSGLSWHHRNRVGVRAVIAERIAALRRCRGNGNTGGREAREASAHSLSYSRRLSRYSGMMLSGSARP
jgi:hypothetical protein